MRRFLTFRSQVHDSVPITANEFPVLLVNGSCSGWADYFKQQMYYIRWMRQGGRESLWDILKSRSFATMRWTFRVLDMSIYIKRVQAHNVFMAKRQIINTEWPDIEIFLASELWYQHALQCVYFSDKSFIYGYFDIIISSILPKAAKAHPEILFIFLQWP